MGYLMESFREKISYFISSDISKLIYLLTLVSHLFKLQTP